MSTTTLEKKIARLHIMLWALTFVVAAILAWPLLMPGSQGALRAESLELVDADGRVLARLASSDGYPQLVFNDGDGVERLRLFHDTQGTGLYVADGHGTTRVGVAQFAHGGGGFALHGQDSKGALVMYYKESGSIRFFGKDGEVIREMSVRDLRGGP